MLSHARIEEIARNRRLLRRFWLLAFRLMCGLRTHARKNEEKRERERNEMEMREEKTDPKTEVQFKNSNEPPPFTASFLRPGKKGKDEWVTTYWLRTRGPEGWLFSEALFLPNLLISSTSAVGLTSRTTSPCSGLTKGSGRSQMV